MNRDGTIGMADHADRFILKGLPPLARQAHDHWKTYRPTMYRALLKSGELRSSLIEAADQTLDELMSLEQFFLKQGSGEMVAASKAREIVLPRYILLPDEEDVPNLGVDQEPYQ